MALLVRRGMWRTWLARKEGATTVWPSDCKTGVFRRVVTWLVTRRDRLLDDLLRGALVRQCAFSRRNQGYIGTTESG
jgi:hypothetical protein